MGGSLVIMYRTMYVRHHILCISLGLIVILVAVMVVRVWQWNTMKNSYRSILEARAETDCCQMS